MWTEAGHTREDMEMRDMESLVLQIVKTVKQQADLIKLMSDNILHLTEKVLKLEIELKELKDDGLRDFKAPESI